MSYRKGGKIVLMILAGLFFATILTGLVMYLWNWLMPELFGLVTISFWQALGVLALSKILFGGWIHKGGSHRSKDQCKEYAEKWKNLPEEQRHSIKSKFMQKWAECKYENDTSSDNRTDNI